MKKIVSILGITFIAITFYSNLQLNSNVEKTANLFEFALQAAAQTEYEEDKKETVYESTTCCTNDEGCEECETIITVRCWLPGDGCQPDYIVINETIC